MGFKANLATGQVGETILARWFQRQGFSILPVYATVEEFKGPRLFAPNRNQWVAPDMLVFRPDGRVKWVEAKHKTAFTWHRQTQTWNTGIDWRHYEHYKKVQQLAPWELWLYFLHQPGIAKDTPAGKRSPEGIFAGPLSILTNRVHHVHPQDAPLMVYWTHDAFPLWIRRKGQANG